MKMRLAAALLLLVSLLVSPSAARAAPAAAPPALPGGKANWVVSVGGLDDDRDPANWVRLGYYVFAPDGTVVTNFWNWTESAQPQRVNTVKADCTGFVPHCYVRTSEGFTGNPTGGFTGTFAYDAGGHLVVTW